MSIRQCGRPECRICQHNLGLQEPDSGHYVPSWTIGDFLGAAAIVVLGFLLFVVLAVAA